MVSIKTSDHLSSNFAQHETKGNKGNSDSKIATCFPNGNHSYFKPFNTVYRVFFTRANSAVKSRTNQSGRIGCAACGVSG